MCVYCWDTRGIVLGLYMVRGGVLRRVLMSGGRSGDSAAEKEGL